MRVCVVEGGKRRLNKKGYVCVEHAGEHACGRVVKMKAAQLQHSPRVCWGAGGAVEAAIILGLLWVGGGGGG